MGEAVERLMLAYGHDPDVVALTRIWIPPHKSTTEKGTQVDVEGHWRDIKGFGDLSASERRAIEQHVRKNDPQRKGFSIGSLKTPEQLRGLGKVVSEGKKKSAVAAVATKMRRQREAEPGITPDQSGRKGPEPGITPEQGPIRRRTTRPGPEPGITPEQSGRKGPEPGITPEQDREDLTPVVDKGFDPDGGSDRRFDFTKRRPGVVKEGQAYTVLVRSSDGEMLHVPAKGEDPDDEAANYADEDEEPVGIFKVDAKGIGRLVKVKRPG